MFEIGFYHLRYVVFVWSMALVVCAAGVSEAVAWESHREITKAAVKENLHEVLVDCSMLLDLCYPFMAYAQFKISEEDKALNKAFYGEAQ